MQSQGDFICEQQPKEKLILDVVQFGHPMWPTLHAIEPRVAQAIRFGKGKTVDQQTIDPARLRRVLGSFVTGVTVVTTRNGNGSPVGLTVNSFNSVSLSPPLVLWSLSTHAVSYAAFVKSAYFAVNILSADQIKLSETFAKTSGDKFNGIAWRSGYADMPLLDGATAYFVCRNVHQYPGGDHTIFIGEVSACEQTDNDPLVYARGTYTRLADADTTQTKNARSTQPRK